MLVCQQEEHVPGCEGGHRHDEGRLQVPEEGVVHWQQELAGHQVERRDQVQEMQFLTRGRVRKKQEGGKIWSEMTRDVHTGNLTLIKVIYYGVRKSTRRRKNYLPGKMPQNKSESVVSCDRKPVKFLEDDNTKLSLEDIPRQEIKQSEVNCDRKISLGEEPWPNEEPYEVGRSLEIFENFSSNGTDQQGVKLEGASHPIEQVSFINIKSNPLLPRAPKKNSMSTNQGGEELIATQAVQMLGPGLATPGNGQENV